MADEVQALAALAGAATGAAGAVTGFASQMASFVGALSPASVEIFSMAMKDLSAVVGTALLPVFEALTGAVQEAGDLLLPVARELAPVLGQLAQTVMTVLRPVMQAAAEQLRAVVPLVGLFGDVLAALAPPFVALQTVTNALATTFAQFVAGLFGGDAAKDAVANFKSAMQQLAQAALRAVVGVLVMTESMFGFGGKMADNIIKSLRGGDRESARGLGGATPGQATSVMGFEQSQLVAAFAAGVGGAGARTDNQWLEQTATELEKMRNDSKAAEGWLRENFRAALVTLEAIKDVLGKGRAAYDSVAELRQRNPRTAGVIGAALFPLGQFF